jgi:acyl carrier protein phosphodiesterase
VLPIGIRIPMKIRRICRTLLPTLTDNHSILSEMMPYMIEHNWLVSYVTIEGIHQILNQMDQRTKKMNLKCGLLMNFLNFIIHRILEEEFTNFKN